MPSQVTNGSVKSARPAYTASYAAVLSVTFLKRPSPPSRRMIACSTGISDGSPKPA